MIAILALVLGSGAVAKEYETEEVLRCKAPGTVFTADAPLEFELSTADIKPLSYQVCDFKAVKVLEKEFPQSGKLCLPALPPGYYTIALNGKADTFKGVRSFAIVPEINDNTVSPDSFFAMDTAMSWLSRPDKTNKRISAPTYELTAELCRLAGIKLVRERIAWREVESAAGQYNWKHYGQNAKLLSSKGIKICNMFHDSPQWIRYDKDNQRPTILPDDLMETWNFTHRLGKEFQNEVPYWEFWNEADHHSSHGAPWNLAASGKAAYLGFKSANPKLQLLYTSFCIFPMGGYANLFFANGMADYFDIFNGHIYEPLFKYDETITGIKQKMKEYGIADKPLFITENGTHQEGRCTTAVPYRPGVKEHAPEQNLVVAEFVPKSQILLQSMGIAKDFFFVLPPYNENDGKKVWGMLRWDFTVKPSYVAFATLTRQLGNARYLGTWNMGDNNRAFLYQLPDGSQTLAFWSISKLEQAKPNGNQKTPAVPVKISAAADCRLTDIVGKTTVVKAENGYIAVTPECYPAYVSGLKGLTPETLPPAIPERAAVPADKDITVVINPYFAGDSKLSSARTAMNIYGKSCPLRLEIYNFSDQAKKGTLRFDGAILRDLPSEIALAPMSKTVVNAQFEPNTKTGLGSLQINGKFNHKEISNVTVPYCEIEKLKEGPKYLLNCENPARWWKSSSGKLEFSCDKAENALKVDVSFSGPGDRWCYPEFKLDAKKDIFNDAVGFEFEIKGVTHTPGKGFSTAILMLVKDTEKEHGQAQFMKFPVPTAEWTKQTIILDGGIRPEQIKMIRIGVNTTADSLTYWVRNVKIIRAIHK